MKKEVRIKRLQFMHEAKEYDVYQNIVDEYTSNHPKVNIEDLEDELLNEDFATQTSMMKVINARDSLNDLNDKFKRVEKKHGALARTCMEEHYVRGKKQRELVDKYDVGCLSKLQKDWKSWLATALGFDK